ncbi:hypothetical protein Sme01_12170 [Sphaerisporangium melleum]|uniref:DoxX family protein n=1 Tax=Sphaerisporangium melleum TaxID=321316 RepID=A0A917RGE4_9ACTN|nr:hypothetical protein [Sphaerisporangium melleum]GGL07018.1 hypothetical protein GCM10007964_56610 [Sphaerisporangium melleum]GII68741.1 hypothetical protein Sme01_12170 [Sphaerisporangium melleum]
MRFLAPLHHLPLRAATGAYILNSGLGKKDADQQTAAWLHGQAAGAYPFLKDIDPARFARLLSAAETALGVALLLPVVPSSLAGLGLTAFGAGLVGLYLRTPGMREPGGVRPTSEGAGLAKDVWLLGAGLTLALEGCHRGRR